MSFSTLLRDPLARYADVQGRPTQRRLRPLGCFYWGKVWTLSAWCELRGDFRGFRIDRIVDLVVLEEHFQPEPGKTLADLLRKVEAELPGGKETVGQKSSTSNSMSHPP